MSHVKKTLGLGSCHLPSAIRVSSNAFRWQNLKGSSWWRIGQYSLCSHKCSMIAEYRGMSLELRNSRKITGMLGVFFLFFLFEILWASWICIIIYLVSFTKLLNHLLFQYFLFLMKMFKCKLDYIITILISTCIFFIFLLYFGVIFTTIF